MSKFVDVGDVRGETPLPSVAVNYDGQFIENQLDGYMTLTVAGREVISHNITNMGKGGDIDGERLESKTLPAREIEVQYQLKANNNREFQEKFRQLMCILESDEDVKIIFQDDPHIEYRGQVSAMGKIPPNYNNVIGSYTIYCQDPYKYNTEEHELGGVDHTFTVEDTEGLLNYEVTPRLIQISSATGFQLKTTPIRVTNKRSYNSISFDFTDIIEDRTINPGDTFNIDIENNLVYINDERGKNNINYLKYIKFETSDFHGFKVKRNDIITVTDENLIIKVIVRGAWK